MYPEWNQRAQRTCGCKTEVGMKVIKRNRDRRKAGRQEIWMIEVRRKKEKCRNREEVETRRKWGESKYKLSEILMWPIPRGKKSFLWYQDSYLDNQKISRLILKIMFHFRVHENPQLDANLCCINSVHINTYSPYEIHFSVILPYILRSPKYFLHFRFATNIFYAFLVCLMHATCPSHVILFNLITASIFSEYYKY